MENLSRKLEKELKNFTLPEHSKTVKKESLVLFDSYGNMKTKSLRWHKMLNIICFIMIYVTIAAVGGCYVLYKKNMSLNNALKTSEQRIKTLQAQNNDLANRLAANTAQTNPQDEEAGKQAKNQPESMPAMTFPADKQEDEQEYTAETVPDSAEAVTDGNIFESGQDVVEEDSPETEIRVEEEKPEPVQAEKFVPVAVENFDISYYRHRKSFMVKYNIKNIDANSNLISGYNMVVLKTNQADYGNWMALPAASLVSGRPSGEQLGESFVISRFKTVQLEAKTQTEPEKFVSATVFVFNRTGDLITEKNFPTIEINYKP
ncbi:MAG: hypothetical protein GY795_14860 [Desulfobacterales bacterium]|nr:hypothetical protein [Desulfobacterales bacterium]